MNVQVNSVAAAVIQPLDEALGLLDDADLIEIPRLFGRDRAVEQQRVLLDGALDRIAQAKEGAGRLTRGVVGPLEQLEQEVQRARSRPRTLWLDERLDEARAAAMSVNGQLLHQTLLRTLEAAPVQPAAAAGTPIVPQVATSASEAALQLPLEPHHVLELLEDNVDRLPPGAWRDAAVELAEASRVLDDLEIRTDVQRQLAESTRSLIDRNALRFVGITEPGAVVGYSVHPDYAEVGRVRANIQTLQMLDGLRTTTIDAMPAVDVPVVPVDAPVVPVDAPVAPVDAPVAPAADEGEELLDW